MTYERYRIPTEPTPLGDGFPGRFEVIRGEDCINCGTCVEACVYGVHLKEEEDARLMATPGSLLCVGCQRCVMECPVGVLDIRVDPAFKAIGDAYFRPRVVEGVWEEAASGHIPVSGAGYRGPFVQPGFDAIWTDMSEIVRPTRDGIHGREYIATGVDLGRKPPYLDPEDGHDFPPLLELPVPFLFNPLPPPGEGLEVLTARAAAALGTLAIVPADRAASLSSEAVVPRWAPDTEAAPDAFPEARAYEVDGGLTALDQVRALKDARPDAVVFLRMPLAYEKRTAYERLVREGVEVLHLYADVHGREYGVPEPRFIAPVLRDLDQYLVEAGVRDEVTLVASGGIVASEHVPKALLCGADAVALDTTLLLALGWNGHPDGDLPGVVNADWAVQRIQNWANACRDQLLEIMGAMGIRDARRMAGEVGRTMFHEDLEREFQALFPEGGADG